MSWNSPWLIKWTLHLASKAEESIVPVCTSLPGKQFPSILQKKLYQEKLSPEPSLLFIIARVKNGNIWDRYIVSFTLGVTSVDNYYLLRTAASVPSSSCELSYLRSNSCATILLQNFPTHWLSWYLLKMEESTTWEQQFGHNYSSPAVQIPFLFQNMLSSSPHTPHYYFLKHHRLQLISCLQVPASLRPWENKESTHHLEPVKMRQSKVLPARWWQLQHQERDHLFCMVAVQDPHLRKGARLLAKEEVQSQLVAKERKKKTACQI